MPGSVINCNKRCSVCLYFTSQALLMGMVKHLVDFIQSEGIWNHRYRLSITRPDTGMRVPTSDSNQLSGNGDAKSYGLKGRESQGYVIFSPALFMVFFLARCKLRIIVDIWRAWTSCNIRSESERKEQLQRNQMKLLYDVFGYQIRFYEMTHLQFW